MTNYPTHPFCICFLFCGSDPRWRPSVSEISFLKRTARVSETVLGTTTLRFLFPLRYEVECVHLNHKWHSKANPKHFHSFRLGVEKEPPSPWQFWITLMFSKLRLAIKNWPRELVTLCRWNCISESLGGIVVYETFTRKLLQGPKKSLPMLIAKTAGLFLALLNSMPVLLLGSPSAFKKLRARFPDFPTFQSFANSLKFDLLTRLEK